MTTTTMMTMWYDSMCTYKQARGQFILAYMY